ncbi:serine hydrolase [Bradyrhizobium sp. CSA112]|uniref:serine hydrolase domain-containing protein n=1 Tax=Bradyrhizobium sp. CSA112 TaxID=2699170 RepID=UPI0023B14FCB|nr:serine hydrolase [Bradyrhizobium sp. CSA112]MDE5453808.1 serine hydrolase [Bradyrhizobium sp. CSA112]
MQNPRLAAPGIVLGTIMLVASVCSAAAYAQGAAESGWPTSQWPTSTPEERGMDSAALAKLVEFGKSRSFDSLLIVRHGRIVLDAYYAPYAADIPHITNSTTKAVIGTLMAIASKDGLLDSTDRRMLDFFADRSIANVDERKKAVTVQNLLDMTSGLDWEEPLSGRPVSMIAMERSPDWIKFILDRQMSSAPGDIFNYNSGNPHLLSAILTGLTGLSASDYAKVRLFGPLGINTWNWRRDPQGISTGGYGLALLPRDMAKIGYLYLRHGEWEGKPLVPPGWVEKTRHATVNMNSSRAPTLRYSNLFWALPDRKVYMAVGYHCQVIMIFPELDIVAVTTARDFCPFGKMADDISGAVKSETALPPDPAGTSLLAAVIREISTEKPSEVGATPEIASSISGKTYKFLSSALNVRSLSLTLTGPNPRYELEMNSRDPTRPPLKFTGPIGLDGLFRKSDPTVFGVAATKGSWLDGQTFVMERRMLGADAPLQKWTLRFDGGTLNLRGNDRAGLEVSIVGEPAD